ncbi:hypothetical protein L3081_11025 [Colwellia sp. MSW7]|uniref:Uncharacterized protein n=1 Tax=Colwellia maritima TaxID=2912588 RepID=A0ABS9X0Q4_9GAMM|nr:hypothetical protein [Colwellia maritima]MCI2283833.1 hypothetical protein [Colwellia maritima]
MSEHLNKTKVKPKEHKSNALVHHTSAKNLNNDQVNNNTSLYCFFTRINRDDIVTNVETKQNKSKKSPIPTRVTVIDVYNQDNTMSNKDQNSLVKPEKPVAIIDKINTALSKLNRLNKSMMLFFK